GGDEGGASAPRQQGTGPPGEAVVATPPLRQQHGRLPQRRGGRGPALGRSSRRQRWHVRGRGQGVSEPWTEDRQGGRVERGQRSSRTHVPTHRRSQRVQRRDRWQGPVGGGGTRGGVAGPARHLRIETWVAVWSQAQAPDRDRGLRCV